MDRPRTGGLRLPLLVVGLGPMLMKTVGRLPATITTGAALLGFLTGETFVGDPFPAGWVNARVPVADFTVGGFGAVLWVAAGTGLQHRRLQPLQA